MKPVKRYYIIAFFVIWMLYPLLHWLFSSWFGREPWDFFMLIILGFIYALMLTGGLFALAHISYKPKLKFLNSADTHVPAFGNKTTKTFDVERSDFRFEAIKNRLKEKHYEIAFCDDKQHIIKFHSKLYSWNGNDMCGMIIYDPATKTATVTCFPMQGYTETIARYTRKTVDETGSLIVNA